jgi:glycine/D-amino acid oxidase-like deaminating enzyme
VDAGFVDVPAVTRALRQALHVRGMRVAENSVLRGIARSGHAWSVATESGLVDCDALVITAGLGTNDVLELVPGCSVRFPLRPDRPSQSKYFIPPARTRSLFTEAALPVFAHVNIGIYGHPLYDGKTPGVKIGSYNPPDATLMPSQIRSVEPSTWPTPAASMPARMTSSQTMISFSARSPARMMSSPGSGGAAPDIKRHRI